MQALSHIDAILIRAAYNTQMATSSILDVSLDTAVPHNTGQGAVLVVEECTCPSGYAGTSCEVSIFDARIHKWIIMSCNDISCVTGMCIWLQHAGWPMYARRPEPETM